MVERICIEYGKSCDKDLMAHLDGQVGLLVALDGIDSLIWLLAIRVAALDQEHTA